MTILLFTLLSWAWLQASPPQAPSVDDVVTRAAAYALEYEQQLTSIIAEENYDQTARVNRFLLDGSTYTDIRQRNLHSDFLITTVDNRRVAIRNVRQVDGMTIESASSFSTRSADHVRELVSESARFNIGGIQRDFNLPTFALEVLRSANRRRFHFDPAGEEDIDHIHLWKVAFKEVSRPALVQEASTGNDFPSSGVLWIEPETGEVLKTEIRFEGISAGLLLSVATTVEFGSNAELGFLVPLAMAERYSQQHVTIECHAEYLNYRRFEVEVKLDTGNAEPGIETPSVVDTRQPTSTHAVEPLDVLLLFDRSALQQNTVPVMQRAVRSSLQGLGPEDRVAVGRIDSAIEMISWWTNDRTELVTALDRMVNPAVVQTSSLYALISQALRSELLPIAGRRRAIVILTAGRDDEMFTATWRSGELPSLPSIANRSLLKLVAGAGIPVHIVAFNTDQNYQASNNPDDVVNVLDRYFRKTTLKTDFLKQARLNLEEISRKAKGSIVFPKKLGDIPSVYSQITRNLVSSQW